MDRIGGALGFDHHREKFIIIDRSVESVTARRKQQKAVGAEVSRALTAESGTATPLVWFSGEVILSSFHSFIPNRAPRAAI